MTSWNQLFCWVEYQFSARTDCQVNVNSIQMNLSTEKLSVYPEVPKYPAHMLCILTSFWVLRTPNFFFLFKHFSVNFHLKPVKNININQKNSRYCKDTEPLGNLYNMILCTHLQHSFFTFLSDFRWKFTEICFFLEIRLKTDEKSVLTSFRVCTAPKSWSKYTTHTHKERERER